MLRAVPRVDRGEFVNVGVLLYCQAAEWLGGPSTSTRTGSALGPDVDVDAVRRAVDAVRAVCDGAPAAGDAGRQPLGVRFRWLTAPRSTLVQPGPVHAGVTADPAARLQQLLTRLVR